MPSEEGRIEIFVADLKDPNDKYRIEQILNNELYKVLEEKVHMSAKGDIQMYLKYIQLDM
jgi:hypothetical protein